MNDTISRQDVIKSFTELWECIGTIGDREEWEDVCVTTVNEIKSAQPQYEELTPEEAASEIANGSIMSAWYWLDDMIRLKQMGYVICRKR